MSETGVDGKERHAALDALPGFRTGREILAEQGLAAVAAEEIASRHGAEVAEYRIRPVMSWDDAKETWNTFLELKRRLLEDGNCYDTIEGSKELNRTGATRLATAFGISEELVKIDEVEIGKDRRFAVRTRARWGARYADGIGVTRLSDFPEMTKERRTTDGRVIPARPVPIGDREHFAIATAYTRGLKRAIADLLGGTEAE